MDIKLFKIKPYAIDELVFFLPNQLNTEVWVGRFLTLCIDAQDAPKCDYIST